MLASCSRCPAPSVSCAAARRTRSVAASAECAWRSERAAAEDQHKSRRHLLLAAGSAAALLLPRPAQAEEAAAAAAAAPAIEILSDEPGTVGTASARQGDLVLVHYVGTVVGKVFDSTRGGQVNYFHA